MQLLHTCSVLLGLDLFIYLLHHELTQIGNGRRACQTRLHPLDLPQGPIGAGGRVWGRDVHAQHVDHYRPLKGTRAKRIREVEEKFSALSSIDSLLFHQRCLFLEAPSRTPLSSPLAGLTRWKIWKPPKSRLVRERTLLLFSKIILFVVILSV